MTNLELLSQFYYQYFGANCYHNRIEDGYKVYDDNKAIETLSIYMPNETLWRNNLADKIISGKLEYSEIENVDPELNINHFIFLRFILNGETFCYMPCYEFNAFPFPNHRNICNYFLGFNITNQPFVYFNKKLNSSGKEIVANEFGNSIFETIITALKRKSLPIVSKESNFDISNDSFNCGKYIFYDNNVFTRNITEKFGNIFEKMSNELKEHKSKYNNTIQKYFERY